MLGITSKAGAFYGECSITWFNKKFIEHFLIELHNEKSTGFCNAARLSTAHHFHYLSVSLKYTAKR